MRRAVKEAVAVFESLPRFESALDTAAEWCVSALRAGGKVLACGNGGSAAEAQHLTGELMGRYLTERHPAAAVTLCADASVMTCIGNDYCYDEVFARQVRGLGRPGDVLAVFTTSGNSENVIRALQAAREAGVKSIAFLGRDGGKARQWSDCALVVPHPSTARVQEAHQFLMHCLMDRIDAEIIRR